MKQFNKSLFLFQRDLRIVDNIGLNNASKLSNEVYCVFCFDNAQVGRANEWRSEPGQHFLVDSLLDLSIEIKNQGGQLGILAGPLEKVLWPLTKKLGIDAIFLNIDYTPFSIKRRAHIQTRAKHLGIEYFEHHDILLLGGPVKNKGGNSYKKFGPYYDHYQGTKIESPGGARPRNLARAPSNIKIEEFRPKSEPKWQDPATREFGLKKLRAIPKTAHDYYSSQNLLSFETTKLSPYVKFGLVSIREVYEYGKEIGPKTAREHFIRQLFWRDFFYNLAMDDEALLTRSFDPKFENIKTKSTTTKQGSELYKKWVKGLTGFPVVDAAMRQIAAEGYMHNRARLIVASFFTKDLLFYWREGEKYFANSLVDYDPIINNYNWQIVAGTGPFALAWYRIFSPWEQSKKYDPEATYIKRWVPELKDVPAKDIHKWYDTHKNYKVNYPPPCFDHNDTKNEAIRAFKTGLR